MRAKGPPCVVCGKPVPLRTVTRCPWCRRVLCLSCECPNNCARPTPRVPSSTGSKGAERAETALASLPFAWRWFRVWQAAMGWSHLVRAEKPRARYRIARDRMNALAASRTNAVQPEPGPPVAPETDRQRLLKTDPADPSAVAEKEGR